jgi:tetratricopeptide (TPR) repeat protein
VAVSLSDGGVVVWNLQQVRAELANFDIPLPSMDTDAAIPRPNNADRIPPSIDQMALMVRFRNRVFSPGWGAQGPLSVAEAREARPFLLEALGNWEHRGWHNSSFHLNEYACGRARIHLLLAVASLLIGDFEACRDQLQKGNNTFQQLAEYVPKNPLYRDGLAFSFLFEASLLEASGQARQAVTALRKCVALREQLAKDAPDVPQYHAQLALAYHRLGLALQSTERFQDAEEVNRQAFDILMKLKNEYPHATEYSAGAAAVRKQSGELLAASDRAVDAVSALRQAIELDPAQAPAHDRLARLLATSSDPKVRNPTEAVKSARRAVELAPTNGTFWNTLGIARFRAGDWREAVEALETARELSGPRDNLDLFILAMAQWRLGDKEKARREYDEAVRALDKNRPGDAAPARSRDEAAALLGIREQRIEK